MKNEFLESDKRVPPGEEVKIKAELKSRSLSAIIDRFNDPSTPPDERNKLKALIFKGAEKIHDTLTSNEP